MSGTLSNSAASRSDPGPIGALPDKHDRFSVVDGGKHDGDNHP